MTHVLMTADAIGGVWTYVMELVAALRAHDVRVTLATMGARLSLEQRRQADHLRLLVYQSDWKLEWMHEPWAHVKSAGNWLLDLERSLVPDVIHLNGYAHAALPWSAPTLVVAHSCVLSWHRAVRGHDADETWQRYRQAVRAGLNAASLVVVPTVAMAKMLQQFHGPVSNACIIPNGRDATQFRPLVKQAMVISAGRWWDEAKNLSTLDAAAARVRWPVVVAGDTVHPEGYAAPQPSSQVRCLGRQTQQQMAHWLGISSICALPARYEPFGLTALEAALAGCVLVLGDLDTYRETWGPHAVYVDPNRHDHLAEAINSLINEPDRRADLAAAARQRALELSPQRMAGQYVSAYDSIRRLHRLRLQATG